MPITVQCYNEDLATTYISVTDDWMWQELEAASQATDELASQSDVPVCHILDMSASHKIVTESWTRNLHDIIELRHSNTAYMVIVVGQSVWRHIMANAVVFCSTRNRMFVVHSVGVADALVRKLREGQ